MLLHQVSNPFQYPLLNNPPSFFSKKGNGIKEEANAAFVSAHLSSRSCHSGSSFSSFGLAGDQRGSRSDSGQKTCQSGGKDKFDLHFAVY
jgi:hypothetical protein